MPIESRDGCIIITGENSISYARIVTLRYALALETKGLGRRGRSAYSVVKEQFGFRGSKVSVLNQLDGYIARTYPDARSAQ